MVVLLANISISEFFYSLMARLRETAVTLFSTRHKHINNGAHGGDGALAAVCVFLSHTKQREEKPLNRCNAVAGIKKWRV